MSQEEFKRWDEFFEGVADHTLEASGAHALMVLVVGKPWDPGVIIANISGNPEGDPAAFVRAMRSIADDLERNWGKVEASRGTGVTVVSDAGSARKPERSN